MEGKVRTKFDVNIQHCAQRITQHRPRRQFNTQHSTLHIAEGFN